MEKIKIPLISGIIGFLLILLVNIIQGNSFLVIISRSLFYGSLTFGIIFGIKFVFNNFLNINFNSDNQENNSNNEGETEKEEETNSVDFVIGNENERSEAGKEVNLENDSGNEFEKERIENSNISGKEFEVPVEFKEI